MSVPPSRLLAPLEWYAARLHRAVLRRSTTADNDICSPLGAWLLLGLVAEAGEIAPGSAAGDALATALGCPLPQAASTTRSLLTSPHTVCDRPR